ncbi:hypothetical protein MVEN_00276700 [Mycena venus]|uniref:Uncharacterized protein n=1 Tax=Mycena venus TaxID=2733690 RepID=A0A8H6Z567_9AGAR|nr:hypothetical protein MVEN_00276700 [Mycena venus]
MLVRRHRGVQTESATPRAPPPPDSLPSLSNKNTAIASNEPPRNELTHKTSSMALHAGCPWASMRRGASSARCGWWGHDDVGGAFAPKHWEAHRLTGQQHPGQHSPPHPNSNGSSGQCIPPRSTSGNPTSDAAAATHLNNLYARGESHRVPACGQPRRGVRGVPRPLCQLRQVDLAPAQLHVLQHSVGRARQKSCLGRKSNVKNVYALEERNATFAKDPDVREFDARSILCGTCDKWFSIPVDHHPGAVAPRHLLERTVSTLKNVIANASAAAMASGMNAEAEDREPVISSSSSASAGPSPRLLRPWRGQSAPDLSLDLSPTKNAAPFESCRCNAEQCATTLRADVLIREVEPNLPLVPPHWYRLFANVLE